MELAPFASTFLFVFAIAFAMLAYANTLKSRSASAVVAAIIAFFSATYAPFVSAMTNIMPIAAGGLVVLFFIVFIREVLFKSKEGKKASAVPAALGLAVSLLVLGTVWPRLTQVYGIVGLAAENLVYIIAIIAVLVILWAGYKEWGGP